MRSLRSKKLLAALIAATLLLGGCREEILHDLDEARANEAALVLERAKIEVKKSRSGSLWMLSVAQDDAIDALATIERSRVLARDLNRYKEQAKGFLQTKEDRLHGTERQLAWGLETTLERIPHVLEAKVHLRLEENPAFAAKQTELTKSAAVLLVVDEENAVLSAQAQQLVAAAAGLEAARITVVLTKAAGAVESAKLPGASMRSFAASALGALCLFAAAILALLLVRRARNRSAAEPHVEPLRPLAIPPGMEVQ